MPAVAILLMPTISAGDAVAESWKFGTAGPANCPIGDNKICDGPLKKAVGCFAITGSRGGVPVGVCKD
jgi:hypothetical protein